MHMNYIWVGLVLDYNIFIIENKRKMILFKIISNNILYFFFIFKNYIFLQYILGRKYILIYFLLIEFR